MSRTVTLSVTAGELDGVSIGFYKSGDGSRHVTASFNLTDTNGQRHSFGVDKAVANVAAWTAANRTALQALLSAWLQEARSDLNLQP